MNLQFGLKSEEKAHLFMFWASLIAQKVKNWPAVQETWVRSLSLEDPLEKEGLPTSVFLPGESHGPRKEPGELQSMGSQRVRYD